MTFETGSVGREGGQESIYVLKTLKRNSNSGTERGDPSRCQNYGPRRLSWECIMIYRDCKTPKQLPCFRAWHGSEHHKVKINV